jgi:hypothetical protein
VTDTPPEGPEPPGDRHRLEVGGGIALVIGALTLFVRFGSQGPGGSNH